MTLELFGVSSGGSGGSGSFVTHRTTITQGGDVTSQVNSALSTMASAAISDGSYMIELDFEAPGTYTVAGALQQGGAPLANAQIPLPWNPGTNKRLVIIFRGPRDGANTTPATSGQASATGAVIASTLTGQVYSTTYGRPSVIGGPTVEQSSAFNNILVIFDGVHVRCPDNPSLSGIDLSRVAERHFTDLRVDTAAATGSATYPTHAHAIALLDPGINNNGANSVGGTLQVQGFYGALAANEHTSIDTVCAYQCVVGLCPIETYYHAASIRYLDVEDCSYTIAGLGTTGVTGFSVGPGARSPRGVFFNIDMLDIEEDTGAFALVNNIYDPNNSMGGRCNFLRVTGGTGAVGGGLNNNGALFVDAHDISGLAPKWTNLTLQNGWLAFGAPYDTPGYSIRNGLVRFRGAMKSGTTGVNGPAVLPAAIAPASQKAFSITTGAASPFTAAFLEITTAGNIQIDNGASTGFVSLDGLEYEIGE